MRLLWFLILISLVGISLADQAQAYTAYVQGGKSSITNESNSMMVITVDDLVSTSYISYGDRGVLQPVFLLNAMTVPLNAALVFSSSEGDSVSLVQVSNISYSEKNTQLTLRVQPLEYYEGSALNHIISGYEKANLASIKPLGTGIYLEIDHKIPENMEIGQCCYNEERKYPGMTCHVKAASGDIMVPYCYCSGNGQWWNLFC